MSTSLIPPGRPRQAAQLPSNGTGEQVNTRRTSQIKLHLYVALAIFVLAACVWLVQTKSKCGTWADCSRMAAIESLVERGTWQIDESDFRETGDKVYLNGHFYSDKPPLLSFLTAQIYRVMYHSLGADLANGECMSGEICVYRWLTFLVVGLSSALLLASFYWFSSKVTKSVWRSLLPTGLLMVGTMIWPYSLVFNNHIPAAACLFLGFQLLCDTPESGVRPSWRIFLGGLLVALAASFDLTAAFVAIPLSLLVVFGQPRKVVPFLAGALIPVVLTGIFDYQISGSIFPPYFLSEGYRYPGGKLFESIAGIRPPSNILLYAFDNLVGYRGLLVHNPVVLWGIAGLLIVICRKRRPLWWPSALLLAGILVQMLVVLTRTSDFGGHAYGTRWFIIWIPLVLYYLPFALPAKWSWRAFLNVSLLSVATMLSILSAFQGVQRPWYRSLPLVHLYIWPDPPFIRVQSYLERDMWTNFDSWVNLVTCPRWAATRWAAKNASEQSEMPAGVRPLWANFDNRIMLLGYELPPDPAKAGKHYPIVVYWQDLAPQRKGLSQTNLLLDQQLRVFGEADRELVSKSNAKCQRLNRVVKDRYSILVNEGAEDGVYHLLIGVHYSESMAPLKLIHDDRRSETAEVVIGPFKVGGPPPGVTVAALSPENTMNKSFGGVLRLVGYDLSQTDEALALTLYWESLAEMDSDYTVFVHMVDDSGQLISQKDRPPADGRYPTSLWEPGEVIKDEIVLPLTSPRPSGKLNLRVGLYNLESGKRLAIQGSESDSVYLSVR